MVFPPFFEWGEKPLELFKLLGTIAIQTDQAQRSLDEMDKKAHHTQGNLGKAFEKIGSAAVACGKVIATGLAVGAAAFSTLTVKAMNLAGELEQNIGGASAVFGEYASKMEATAKTAFSSMGLSASDFLATANKMGSLFKGAGFEVEEAADLTATAMQRAADVASIMGIDVSVAMESVAGAAKGNFTMMDNLGVAMNDTNLQAYALSKGIQKTTQEMTSQEKISLAMQMFLEKTADYAGNYAKENDTLAGSLTTAKAALSNFLSGAGDAGELADALVASGRVISQKLLGLLPALVSGISSLCNALIPELPVLFQTLLPAVVDGAVALVEGLVSASGALVSALMGMVPELAEGAMRIMESLGSALLNNIEFILDTALQVVTMFAQGLIDNLPRLADAACTLVERLGEWIANNAPAIVEAGVKLIATLTATLVKQIPKLIKSAAQAVVKALPALLNAFSGATKTMSTLEKIVLAVVAAFIAFKAVGAIVSIINAVKTAFVALNATMAANPIGLVVGAVAGLAAAFGLLSSAQEETTETTVTLSEEYMSLREEVEGTVTAMRDALDAHEENARLIARETEETKELWEELQTLTDENGYVTDANKERADYILGELNEALGTEYSMNGNIIGQYQQMQEEIEGIIEMKQAELLLTSAGEKYAVAKAEHDDLVRQVQTAQQEWENYWSSPISMLPEARAAIESLTPEERDEIIERAANGATETELVGDYDALSDYMDVIAGMYGGYDKLPEGGGFINTLLEKLPLYDAYADGQAALDANYKIMSDYETAVEAASKGDFGTTIDTLTDKTSQLWNAVARGEELSDEAVAAIEDDLGRMQWEVENYAKRLNAGAADHTEEVLRDLEADYREKRKRWTQYNRLYGNDSQPEYTDTATGIPATEIELTPVKLDDDAIGSVNRLRDEITRLADVIAGMIAGGYQFKINGREFGRLVRAELK